MVAKLMLRKQDGLALLHTLIGGSLALALPVAAQEAATGNTGKVNAVVEQPLREQIRTNELGWTPPEPPDEVNAAQAVVSEEGQSVLFGMTFDRVDDRAFVLSTARWGDADIPVCWENPNAASPRDRVDIQDAVLGSWGANSCLRFNGWGTCGSSTRGIRIRIADEGPRALKLGRRLDGVRDGIVLNVTYQNWSPICATNEEMRHLCNKAIAVHEFGHGIGFSHEQNRWDTPGECVAPSQGQNGDTILTDWDASSTMSYCNVTYANGGILSEGDVTALQEFYCAPGEDIP